MDAEDRKGSIADALGAARVVEVGRKRAGGPLDLLALRQEFEQRLRSRGGRPTDPSWTVSRQVPFTGDSRSRLQNLASEVGVSGRRVGPAQIAALLIENSLQELDDAEWQKVVRESRAHVLLSQPDAAAAVKVTYNQFDAWVQRGWLLPAKREGHERFYGTDEVVRALWLRWISLSRSDVESVAAKIRSCDLSARYLVLTDAEVVSVATSRSELYRLLESAGSHLVIDQLPERRKLLETCMHPGDDES